VRVDREFFSEEAFDGIVDVALRGEARDSGHDELRRLHAQRRLDRRRIVRDPERPRGPAERVEQLAREILLEELVEVGRIDERVLHEELLERHFLADRRVEHRVILALRELAERHHVAPERLRGDVRHALDRRSVVEDDLLLQRSALHLEHRARAIDRERQDELFERHVGDFARPEQRDRLQLVECRYQVGPLSPRRL